MNPAFQFRAIHHLPLSDFRSRFEAEERGRQLRAREIAQGCHASMVRWRIEKADGAEALVVERAFTTQ